MSFRILSGLARFRPGLRTAPAAFCSINSGKMCSSEVHHDRENQRFTVTPDSGEGEDAVLSYRFTGVSEVELMSTYVPESCRGRGLAALLSKAALDFVLEEQLNARVSCWYIHKYLDENPLQRYKDRIIT